MNKYTTVQGDMWDAIAYKIFGNELYMNELLEANETYRNTAIFQQDHIEHPGHQCNPVIQDFATMEAVMPCP